MSIDVMERDFSDFYLGDNVYELAGGLIPDVAESLRINIGDEPNSDDLQLIMNQVGPKKELRTNPELELDRDVMAGFVEKSGVQKKLGRSLWTPEVTLGEGTVDAVVIMGGVANWQDRTAAIVEDFPGDAPVHVLAGSRAMGLPTELSNPNVMRLKNRFGKVPTEAQYAGSIIAPRLVNAEKDVLVTPFTSNDGDAMFDELFTQHPELLDSRVALARVANAGVVMAIQMRDAARKARATFDSDKLNPQVFVATDAFPVARTSEQDNDSAHYQKAATALRQVVLSAKKLHETRI